MTVVRVITMSKQILEPQCILETTVNSNQTVEQAIRRLKNFVKAGDHLIYSLDVVETED